MGLTQADIDEISIAFDRNGALNNVEIREAFQKILDSGSGSSSGLYAARISQLATLAPIVVQPMANTTGVNPVWSRSGVGVYVLTFTGFSTLTVDNVFVSATMSTSTGSSQTIRAAVTSVDQITITSFDTSGVASELSANALIKVELY